MAELISTIWAALFEPDERFIMHRYHSSRLALAMGVLMLGAWMLYDLFARGIVRYDLLVILGVMVITKLVAMAYLRLTH